MGQEVIILHAGMLTGGMHEIVCNQRNDAGNTVASGLYIASLVSLNSTETLKMILLK